MLTSRRDHRTIVRRVGASLAALLLSSCADTKVEPPEGPGEPSVCTLNPCDDSCPETRCSGVCDPCRDACLPTLTDEQRDVCRGECDPFCSPCDATCTSCEDACLLTRLGEPLAPLRCDAEPRTEEGDAMFRWAIPLDVPSDSPSWTISATAGEQSVLFGVALEDADGVTIIELDDYVGIVRIQQQLNPYVLPLLFPMADAFAALVQPGPQALIVETEEDEPPCWRVAYQLPVVDDEPFVLRVRMIAVGESLGSTEDLRANTAIHAVVDEARRHMKAAGISLYVDSWEALETDREALSRIQNFGELRALFRAMSAPAHDRPTSELAVPVALVDGFGGDYLVSGITGGIPGPVLLHGASGSGIAVSVNQLYKGNGIATIGAVLAHELGHFLGLMHTTGIKGGDRDPLEDTPVCSALTIVARPWTCPDALNAMFPLIYARPELTWTPEQIRVLRAHPSVNQRRDSAP